MAVNDDREQEERRRRSPERQGPFTDETLDDVEALGYPVWARREEIRKYFRQSDQPFSIVLTGETGSGKTTLITSILAGIPELTGKVIISQPRKLAASENAERTAELMHVTLGQEAGYQYRGEKEANDDTRFLFTVNGWLLRRMQADDEQSKLLLDYSVVVVDEVHERTRDGDVLLSLLKRVQKIRMERNLAPLRIISTSATVDKEKFKRHLETDIVVDVPGTTVRDEFKPVEHYEVRDNPLLDPIELDAMPKKAAEKARDYILAKKAKVAAKLQAGAITQTQADADDNILIFMPGVYEIGRTMRELKRELKALGIEDEFEILPLHSKLPKKEQKKIYGKGKRKIIVSTNIAETSLTVPGVRCVIDSGRIRQKVFDPSSGAERYITAKHSVSGIRQRRGRIGRKIPPTGIPDEYFALFDQDDPAREEFQPPEIDRSNLESIVLLLKKCGIDDVRNFDFIDKPDEKNHLSERLDVAIKSLQDLGALDAEEKLTPVGELMAGLPVEPHAARMIVAAVQNNDGIEEACTLAACFENGNVFIRPRGKEDDADAFRRGFNQSGSDFMATLEAFQRYQEHKGSDNWETNEPTAFLSRSTLIEADKLRDDLIEILKDQDATIQISKSSDRELFDRNIAAGFVDKICYADSDQRYFDSGFYLSAHNPGMKVRIDRNSAVAEKKPNVIVTSSIYQREGYGSAGPAHPISLKTFHAAATRLVTHKPEAPYYSPGKDEVVHHEVYEFKHLSEQHRLSVTDEEAHQAFIHALATGDLKEPIFLANREVFNNGRCSLADLVQFYDGLLPGIKSWRELHELLQQGSVDLLYPGAVTPEEKITRPVIAKVVPSQTAAPGQGVGGATTSRPSEPQPEQIKKQPLLTRFKNFLKKIFS